MTPDRRELADQALSDARVAAYPAGQYVGQESFMLADGIRELARRAGVAAGTSVLDLCCGTGGPGRLITRESGCDYLGVDASPAAVALARVRSAGLRCTYRVASVPPVPGGPFDVVMLLETMLAFPDKREVIAGVAEALHPDGRFACTVEEGAPLTDAERAAMPDSGTVWPIPLAEFASLLQRNGLRVRWIQDCTAAHLEVVDALIDAFTNRRPAIAALLGDRAIDELLAAHRLWSRWMAGGRIRKFAVVAAAP